MYHEKGIPVLNETLSLSVSRDDCVLARVDGELKTIFCDAGVLQNALRKVDGKSSFEEIEEPFIEEFGEEAVKSFFQTLLAEKLIVVKEEKRKENAKGKLAIVGKGGLAEWIAKMAVPRMACMNKLEVEEFLQGMQTEGTDVFVVALERECYTTALEINRRLVELGKPAIWICFDGNALVLGPSVLPWKSTCLECHVTQQLKKLTEMSGEKLAMNAIGKLQYAYEWKTMFRESQMKYIVDLLINEVERIISGSERPEWLGLEMYFLQER